MSWLVLSYFLSIGTIAYQGQTFDQFGAAMFITPEQSFQTTLGVEAQMLDNHLFIGGSVETWESYNGNLFSPSQAFYVFNAGLRGWGFEIGYRHECDHAIISRWGGLSPLSGLGANRDEVYASFSGKLKVF